MPVRIVLADDNDTMRPLLVNLLQLFGAEVVSAPCGPDLCEVVRRERPDLVLLDLVMFPEAAAAVIRQFCKCPVAGRTPIVVVSGWRRQDALYLEAGSDNVVVKPFTRHRLLSALVAALQSKSDLYRHGACPLTLNPNV